MRRWSASPDPRLRPVLTGRYLGFAASHGPHVVLPVDRLLLRRLHTGPAPAAEFVGAWRLLVATGGTAPIRRVADEVGCGHKRLITRFREQVGLTPKTSARLIRFDRVLRALARPEPPAWGPTAATARYADQSHLVREFRTFTGRTPTQFRAGSVP